MKKYLIFIFSVVLMFLCGSTQCFADSVTVTLEGSPYTLGNDDMVYQNVRVDFNKGVNWTLSTKWTNTSFVDQQHTSSQIPMGNNAHVYDIAASTDYQYNPANTSIQIASGVTSGAEYRIYRLGLQFTKGRLPGDYTNTVQFTVSSPTGPATGTALINFSWSDNCKVTVINNSINNPVDPDKSMQQGYVQAYPADMQVQVESNCPWTLYMRTTTPVNTLNHQLKTTSASSFVTSTLPTMTTFPTTDVAIATGNRTIDAVTYVMIPAVVNVQSQITIPTGSITPHGNYPMNVIYTLDCTDVAD